MILADTNWLNISVNLLLVVFVIVCLLMGLLILMQRPKQEGLGAAFGGGVTDQVFGARTTNVLQRGTVYLGSIFFILALTLSILIAKQNEKKSLLEPANTAGKSDASAEPTNADSPGAVAETPVESAPAAENAPAADAPAQPSEDSNTDKPE